MPYTCRFLILLMSMRTPPLDHTKLEEMVLILDPDKADCRLRISELRIAMDHSCDSGLISITQWRLLLDLVSNVQAKCIGV